MLETLGTYERISGVGVAVVDAAVWLLAAVEHVVQCAFLAHADVLDVVESGLAGDLPCVGADEAELQPDRAGADRRGRADDLRCFVWGRNTSTTSTCMGTSARRA